MRPRFGSVFSGVGGFDLGLERAGWECAWQIEVDPFCRRVLDRHWPHVPKWGDVRGVRSADLPAVDLVCGGFPCQDLSVAGRRAGLAGARSGLFHEFTRIVKEMRHASDGRYPTVALLENVPGLLSSNGGRDFAAVLHGLADSGCVEVGWRILDSRHFGVPQRRRRVFLVGHLGGPCPIAVLFEPEGVLGDPAAGGEAGTGVAYSLGRGTDRFGEGPGPWSTNYVVEAPAHSLTAPGRKGGDPTTDTYITAASHDTSPPLMAEGFDASEDGRGRKAFAFAWQQGDDSPHTGTGRGRSWVARAGDYTGALSTTRHDAVAFNHIQDPVSSPSVGTTLGEEGQAVAYTTKLHNTRSNQAGKLYADYSPSLQEHSPAPAALLPAAVRRLTPTECERLQAFPDGWTCLCGVEPYTTAACRCPDGPRYAALGNAVTTSVVEWLGRRLMSVYGT